MLAESKQKNESLSQAYSVLHTEFLKMRSSQARGASHPQRHHSVALPFDHVSALGVGGMDMVDGMYVFQDMPNYGL